MTTRKLLELLSFQLPRARRAAQRRVEATGLQAQGKPVINGRTADVKGAMRLRLAHAFFDGAQYALPQICAISLAHVKYCSNMRVKDYRDTACRVRNEIALRGHGRQCTYNNIEETKTQ